MNSIGPKVIARRATIHDPLHGRAVLRRDMAHSKPVFDMLSLDGASYGGGESRGASIERCNGVAEGFVHIDERANIFASLEANKLARKGGKLLCVKSLADQVNDYRRGRRHSNSASSRQIAELRKVGVLCHRCVQWVDLGPRLWW